MRCLLDTHFFIWVVRSSDRLDEFPWLDRYRPWGLSPISLLEVAYLSEIGRLELDDGFMAAVLDDARFEIDDVSLLPVIRHAFSMSWTRDPFDRLIAAHSAARRVPLCSVDETIRRNHGWIPPELTIT